LTDTYEEQEFFTIPRSINGLVGRLGGIDRLLTDKEWERAGDVYAFTKPERGRPSNASKVSTSEQLSISDFAKLGIRGLSSRTSVLLYRQAWEDAIKKGEADEVRPGQKVRIPKIPWESTRTGTNGYSTLEGAKQTLKKITEKHGPGIVGGALKEDPQLAEGVMEDPDTSESVYTARMRVVRAEQAAKAAAKASRQPKPTAEEEAAWAEEDREAEAQRRQRDGTPSALDQMENSIGAQVGINNARRSIRGVTKALSASHLSAADVEYLTEMLDQLDADIQMLRAVIDNRVDDAAIAAFLKGE